MSKRKIAVITGSRAEYGLLCRLMREIKKDPALNLQVIAAGMHLEKRFGSTYKEILKDGFQVDAQVRMNLNSDSNSGITRSVGLGIKRFGDAFDCLRPDMIVLLGDRFEVMAAALAATLARIPIAHIHGGELTEGAYDDSLRHAVTKLAHWHFVSHKDYARRVIQMGEEPGRVFNFGAPGLDNIKKLKFLEKNELEKNFGFILGEEVALVTYHPETLEVGAASVQIDNLLTALKQSGLRMIFTLPNADAENQIIARRINSFVAQNPDRAKAFASLGQLKYLSLLRQVGLMIGNSSSGLIEAPSFHLPVVNVGERQKGRIQTRNVIDVSAKAELIGQAIKRARSANFKTSLKGLLNPFGDGNSSIRIKNKLKTVDLSEVKKSFYDLR